MIEVRWSSSVTWVFMFFSRNMVRPDIVMPRWNMNRTNDNHYIIRTNGSPLLVKLTLSPDCLEILKSIGEVDESRVAMKPEILVPVSPIWSFMTTPGGLLGLKSECCHRNLSNPAGIDKLKDGHVGSLVGFQWHVRISYPYANHGAGIFTYMTGWLLGQIYIGKYSIHGAYGLYWKIRGAHMFLKFFNGLLFEGVLLGVQQKSWNPIVVCWTQLDSPFQIFEALICQFFSMLRSLNFACHFCAPNAELVAIFKYDIHILVYS